MNWDTDFFGFINIDIISEQSLRLYDLGLERRQKEAYYYDNSSREYKGYLFQYTLEGEGIYEASGNVYRITKGKAFFITFPENSRYYLPTVGNPDQHWTYFFIHFSGPAVEPFFNRIRELSSSVLSLEIDSSAIRLFFELFETLKNGEQLERYKGSEWVYRFLTALLRDVEFPMDRKNSPHVTAAIEWMQTHYHVAQNLEIMSKELGVSFPHLSRLFYKEKGLTPIQYLTQIRLQHAMQLLINTNMTIARIAEECGFSSGNYFSKVYKKVLHVTPVEYRRQHKI